MPETTTSPTPVTRLRSAVPTFLVEDVGATARWYRDTLGFIIAGVVPPHEPHVYASIMRDGAELMLLRLTGYRKPDLTSIRPTGVWDAYIRLEGVEALYEGLRDHECIRMPLTKQPYGDLEFEVRDPNGYILVFGG